MKLMRKSLSSSSMTWPRWMLVTLLVLVLEQVLLHQAQDVVLRGRSWGNWGSAAGRGDLDRLGLIVGVVRCWCRSYWGTFRTALVPEDWPSSAAGGSRSQGASRDSPSSGQELRGRDPAGLLVASRESGRLAGKMSSPAASPESRMSATRGVVLHVARRGAPRWRSAIE